MNRERCKVNEAIPGFTDSNGIMRKVAWEKKKDMFFLSVSSS